MMGFQDLFVAALSALVFACVIAKFVSVAFYENDSKVKVDVNKVVKVVEKVNLGNALKVRESRSKKRVKFVDDVVVRHIDQLGFEEGGYEIGEEIKRVVFFGEEGVFGEGIVEGKNGKDGIFKCFDEQKGTEDGKNLIFSDELDKGMSDEAFEREIIRKRNDIQHLSLERGIVEGKNGKDEIFKCFDEQKVYEDGKNLIFSDELDKGMLNEAFEIEIIGKRNDIQHFSLEEVNVIKEGNSEKVEILKCVDEQRVSEEGKMIYTLEEAFELGYSAQEGDCSGSLDEPFSVKEEKFCIGGIDDMIIEENMIKEETSTSGRSVLESLMVDENMNNEVFSSQNYVDFATEHAALDQKEDIQVERLNENMEVGLSGRDVEEELVEEQGENVEGGLSKEDKQRAMKNENVVIDEDDDDWEGIESTELEKVFAEAVNYVEIGLQGKDDQLEKLGSDVQMQLYGLHKIAVEGPCHQAQPMALNFFARAKWNAWQKLGSISPEAAMEEYIKLLTDHFPEWVQHFYDGDGGQSTLESGISHDADHRCSSQDSQPNLLPEPTKIEEN